MKLTHTHTYAIMEVKQSTFDEIKAKLKEAQYNHAFHDEEGVALVIDYGDLDERLRPG